MESNEGHQQQTQEEAEGKAVLVSIDEDVDASGVDDESTGMGNDDYLGRTHREGAGADEV